MTFRLMALAKRHWASFDGEMSSQRVDPLRLPPHRFFNLVYWWATRNATEESDIDAFDRRLWMPPKGVAPPPGSPWSAEAETAAFAELAGVLGVTKIDPGQVP